MFLESNKLYVFVVSFGLCFFNLEEKHREHFNLLEVYVFVKPNELQVVWQSWYAELRVVHFNSIHTYWAEDVYILLTLINIVYKIDHALQTDLIEN